jgi:hypothetical protein
MKDQIIMFIAGSSFFIGFIIRIIIYCLGFMIGILKAMELGCWQFFLIGLIAFGLGLVSSIKDLIFFENILKIEIGGGQNMAINKSAGPCPMCKSDLENYKYIFVNKDGNEEVHDGVRCTNTKDGVKTGKNCNFSTKG